MAEHGEEGLSLAEALSAAKADPAGEDHWDRLEDLAEAEQRPDEVAALYRELLAGPISPELAELLGRRATAFHEEWFSEDSPHLVDVLNRILEVIPTAEWALQRLTVVMTVNERWDELLDRYDRAIQVTADDAQREQLLDEATQLAKDFAGDSERAIGYLQRLLGLRPADARIASSLERLLERQGRWEELIGLWRRRLAEASGPDGLALRTRIAACYLDHLDDAASALAEVRTFWAEGGDEVAGLALLERIVGLAASPPTVRSGALDLLRRRYEATGRAHEIRRVLSEALPFAEGQERVALHRELGDRTAAEGDLDSALGHLAEVLRLDPRAEDIQERFSSLARQAGQLEAYGAALARAAEQADGSPRAHALRIEAGEVQAELGHTEEALALYQQVLASDARPARRLTVARRLQALLGEAGRPEERLRVLQELARLETDPVERRRVVSQSARLAESLGDEARALDLWQECLAEDAQDLHALDAVIELTARGERWAAHVEALEMRVRADEVPPLVRRSDLARVAVAQAGPLNDRDAAIATWRRAQETFGEDRESVDALSRLLDEAGRHEEVYDLLGRAVASDAERAAEVLARMGDLCAQHLGRAEEAAEAYHRAIEMEPTLARARAGLTALLDAPDAADRAASALARASELTDDWAALLGLLEARLAAARDDVERVRLLREAASIREERADDLPGAFDAARRALAVDPGDPDLEAEITRLAELTERWPELADALRDAAQALGPTRPERAAELHRFQAGVAEERLGDVAAALSGWAAALERMPADVTAAAEVVRTGARVGRWPTVARTLVDASVRRGAPSEAHLRVAEDEARAAGSLRALAMALSEEVERSSSIPPDLGAELHRGVARWLRDDLSDGAAAEEAFLAALRRRPGDVATLEELAGVQRRAPGPALVATLLQLAEARPGDLDPMREAAEVALGPAGTAELAASVLSRLVRAASALWERGVEAAGEAAAPATTEWALEERVRLALTAGDDDAAVDLLIAGSRLPVEPARSRELRRRAGTLLRERGDTDRALRVLQGVVDESVEDAEALVQLGALLEERGRYPELLALRQRQLDLDLDDETRLAARLEVARILRLIESRGGPVEVLRSNLDERPGHEASIDQLATLLRERNRAAELADLFRTQARAVEAHGQTGRAAALWSRATLLLEEELGDVEGALEAHRRVVALQPSTASLDALARLHLERTEPAVAAEWLTRRLEHAAPEERPRVALRLAEAHLAAGADGAAVDALRAALEEHPDHVSARERLADLYRQTGDTAGLAALLSEGVRYEPDSERRLELVREAAALYEQELGTPEAAIPVLRIGAEIAPDDPALKGQLATGLRVAGQLDEARAILEELVATYGRRRSPERAGVHFQLALVAREAGDLEGAMEELDRARKMDMSHPGILRMSGRMAREAGQLERAEKAYRALLLVVRRQDPSSDDLVVGPSEVLYALSQLATAQGDPEQARELLETAISTAAEHDAEARRFKDELLARGESELALRVIDARLAEATEPVSRARITADRAEVLQALQRPDDALDALLAAVRTAPTEDDLHTRCRTLGRDLGATDRYVAVLRDLVEGARREEDRAFASTLLLRLGEATEQDLGDLEEAAVLYGRAEALGVRLEDAWLALARVADARGAVDEELRVLRRLVESDSPVVPGSARSQALYRIAEVELAAGRVDAGLDTLESALRREPRYARAGAILRMAVERTPGHVRLMALYEEMARASGDPALVLDLCERLAAATGGTLEHVREGVERADAIGAVDRAEALLRRGVDIATKGDGELRDALWLPTALAERRLAADDPAGAVEWMRRAAEGAEGPEARDLRLRMAELAAGEGDDPRLAADTYRALLESDPANRELWEPLARVYARLEDREGLESVVHTTVDALIDPTDRNVVRMRYADFLLEVAEDREAAVDVLKEVLDEEPDHPEAGARLAAHFEATGDDAQLVELLHRQLDRARDRQDIDQIAALALRMGSLTEDRDRGEAMDLYRAGLDWAPENRPLLRALLALHGDDEDPRDRAQLMERLVPLSSGEEVPRLADDLVALYTSIDDEYGVGRALDLGFRAAPDDPALRQRLEAWYRRREEWTDLAEMIRFDAAHREEADEAVARFCEAAAVLRDELRSPAEAAEILLQAAERAPGDLAVLEALVKDLVEAGRPGEAADAVASTLEELDRSGPDRPRLLRMRAQLELAVGNLGSALSDLEEAHRLDPEGTAADLTTAVERQRVEAEMAGDDAAASDAVRRLAELHRGAGQRERERALWAEWVDRRPTDIEALRSLRDLDQADERWEDVVTHNEQLIRVATGEAQVEAALGLATACRALGRPQDARPGVEEAYTDQPSEPRLLEAVRALYEETGARAELAELLYHQARSSQEPKARVDLLRRAGELHLEMDDPEGALVSLSEAAAIEPDDHDLVIALSDAYMGTGRYQEAVELLTHTINGFPRRRSPHLAAMQFRMGRIAGLSGDAETQKEWLSVALDADKNNGDVAAELAELAMHLGDDESALKALRVVTLLKEPGPMTKAVAFLRQAQIAHRQGDQQKAVLWARRAKVEDDTLTEAHEFLASIGEA